MGIRAEKAMESFKTGFNCAQAVAVAFADLVPMDEKVLLRAASSFGGGVGRLRSTCGAVSGMVLVAGMLYGYDDPSDRAVKSEYYTVVRDLCEQFRVRHGSIVCKEILGGNPEIGGEPAERTPAFYGTRPCERCVFDAAEILETYLETHSPKYDTNNA